MYLLGVGSASFSFSTGYFPSKGRSLFTEQKEIVQNIGGTIVEIGQNGDVERFRFT